MTPTKRRHFGESWVVEANRERDRQHQIESRELIEQVREEFRNLKISDGEWFPVRRDVSFDLHPVSVVKESEN